MANSGFLKAKCVQVNPDISWIRENYDSEIEEEPEYTYTDNKDRRCCRVDLYLADLEDNIRKYSILLTEEEVIAKSGAYQYVNSNGDTQWAKDRHGLWDSFVAWENILSWREGSKVGERWWKGAVPNEKEVIEDKKFRVAMWGEANLLDYVKNYYDHSPYDITVDVLPNMDKLFEGDFKYLQNLISGQPSDITAFIYTDDDGNEKVYKHFMPKSLMLWINQGMKYGTLDKSLKKRWETFQADCSNDLGELDYELQKYGTIKNPKAVVTPTNSEY